MSHPIRRRTFMITSATATGAALLPERSYAKSAFNKLRTAHIGVGGMGRVDLEHVSGHAAVEVVALCDIDSRRLDAAKMKHPSAVTFADYRELLDKVANKIDAVVVSTPDHTHAPAALSAMKLGKHVYCQKPLTHEVAEARRMRVASKESGVTTQMGIQGHSRSEYLQAVAIIQSGAIGKASEVHAWSFKNWGYDGPAFNNTQAAPKHISWNLWLGTAKERPFVPGVYHPSAWRKLIDFGTGTLGDMGVHIFDTPFTALALTHPDWVRVECRKPTGIGHPEKNIVHYEFPQTQYTAGPLKWTWYDGAFGPPSAKQLKLPQGTQIPKQGSLVRGEKGVLLLPHVAGPVLFPQQQFKNYRVPEVESSNHWHQWVDACIGKGKVSASFEYGGRLTEALLLGVVGNRFPGRTLKWDPKKLATDSSAANRFLSRKYRKGFEVS